MNLPENKRIAVITEAKSWLRTPWHHNASLKGIGVDCAQFLIEVFVNVGLIERPVIPPYARDRAAHSDTQTILAIMREFTRETDDPEQGDLVVFEFGRTYSHCAIVIDYPRVIHAQISDGVVMADANNSVLRGHSRRFYSIEGLVS